MEVRTTVRNFANEMTIHHIPFDARIRVIIEDSQMRRESAPHDRVPDLPAVTPNEQRQRLNMLPREHDAQASEELLAIIEASHVNTDPFEF